MDINRKISNFKIFDIKKMLTAYTETTLNGDFNPKRAIISINTNTNIFFKDSY
jgi:hypothetical protein